MSLLQERDAPLLTSFKWCQLRCQCGYPSIRPSRALFFPLAPKASSCLQVLELSHFVTLPDFQPLQSLRSFSGHNLPPAFSFDAFPCLETLHLSQVTIACLKPLHCLPQSITIVTLETSRGHVVDFSPFYRTCLQRRLPKLKELFAGSVSAGVSDGIRLFLDSTSGPYRLDFLSGLRLESSADGITHKIRPSNRGSFLGLRGSNIHYPQYPAMQPDTNISRNFALLLGRLSSLALHLPQLRFLDPAVQTLEWDCSMPLLRDLQIHVQNSAQRRVLNELPLKLLTPQLENVTFYMPQPDVDAATTAQWLADDVPRALPLLLSNTPFIKMTVWVGDAQQLLAQELSLLASIARTLSIGNLGTGAEVEVSHEDEHEPKLVDGYTSKISSGNVP